MNDKEPLSITIELPLLSDRPPVTNDEDGLVVIAAASNLCVDEAKAEYWYLNQRIREFDWKTPQQLVKEGRAGELLNYIHKFELEANEGMP